MYYPVTLVLRSYRPLALERGMLFVNNISDVRELSNVPSDEESYVKDNGYPVEPYIIDPVNGDLLAQPHQIAYIDEGAYYREIKTSDIQRIVNNEVTCYLLIDDEDMNVSPVIEEGRVCLFLEGDEA